MATRNPTGWTKIRDTVKDAQDILSRLGRGLESQTYWWGGTRGEFKKWLFSNQSVPPICPPQTLGGLCLEIAEDKLLKYKVHDDETDLIRTYRERIGVFGIKETKWFPRTEIDDIRRAMYHKNTDP